MTTPTPYAPVILPFDARDQIERALLGRTTISGAAAVMSLLMQWPCVEPPSSEDTPAPRAWWDATTEPPADIHVLWDPIAEAEAYLCRVEGGGWSWFDHPEDAAGVTGGITWDDAMEEADGPLTEVPARGEA